MSVGDRPLSCAGPTIIVLQTISVSPRSKFRRELKTYLFDSLNWVLFVVIIDGIFHENRL